MRLRRIQPEPFEHPEVTLRNALRDAGPNERIEHCWQDELHKSGSLTIVVVDTSREPQRKTVTHTGHAN